MENPYKSGKFNMFTDTIWYARAKFGKEEIDAVNKCLNEFQLSPGKYTFEFERAIARLYGKENAVMVNSGSSANLLLAELLNIKEGDEIITGATAFPTTISPFLLKGATVVLVDNELGTLCPKIDQIEKAITPKTKAIIVAHLFGSLNDLPLLRGIANQHNILLIEDSCDCLGQRIQEKPSGIWADYSTTSFYPAHVITAMGGGGMLIVNNDKEEKRARQIRDWGRTGTDSDDLDDRFSVDLEGIPYDAKFFYGEFGYNLKAVEPMAAFGLAQLNNLEAWNIVRRSNYYELTKRLKVGIKPITSIGEPSWLAFPFLVQEGVDRIKLAKHLEKNNIQTRPIMSGNITLHPAYKSAKFRVPRKLKNADFIARQGMVIGLHQGIGEPELDHIESAFKEFFK